jgi:hypothetical protein
MQEAFYRACVAADFPEYPDVHHPDATGLSLRAENNVDGVRMSTALTYLQPSRHRAICHPPAGDGTTHLFAGTRAMGVEVDSGGERFLRGQEVVLSAGPRRPTSSCSPVWDRAHPSVRSACRWCTISPAWARTCATIPTCRCGCA